MISTKIHSVYILMFRQQDRIWKIIENKGELYWTDLQQLRIVDSIIFPNAGTGFIVKYWNYK